MNELWAKILELSQTSVIIHQVLHTYADRPREEILMRLVVAMDENERVLRALLVQKIMNEIPVLVLGKQGE